jgi:hypothetical protein
MRLPYPTTDYLAVLDGPIVGRRQREAFIEPTLQLRISGNFRKAFSETAGVSPTAYRRRFRT